MDCKCVADGGGGDFDGGGELFVGGGGLDFWCVGGGGHFGGMWCCKIWRVVIVMC